MNIKKTETMDLSEKNLKSKYIIKIERKMPDQVNKLKYFGVITCLTEINKSRIEKRHYR